MHSVVNVSSLRGLYAITPDHTYPNLRLASQVVQAIQGGAKIVQYRNKNCNCSPQDKQATVEAVLKVCQAYQVPLLINDDVELALTIQAAGVHLGQTDMDPTLARQHLGPQVIIGVSCYNSLDLAIAAQAVGANYVAFGRFFASTTKPLAVSAQPKLLKQARSKLHIPIVAIGGITPMNGKNLITQGADMLAVVGALFAVGDIKTNAKAFANLF